MSAIAIFPEGSLSESVVTTVWVGVFVVCLFNLRLGWTASGLVVPGYLVPLMIAKPWGAAVVIVEALLTYGLVWFFSEACSRAGIWASLFGRDRFFAFVLSSIVVRIGLDGYLLPHVGRYITEEFQLPFDPVHTLHSFGLIIVSLIANQLWKPGLRRGLLPLASMITITYLLVRYPLMLWTNFSVSGLEYMYEDISSSVLASPKAYIILLTAAFLASRMNLYYAWDFNGILIPSLLALQWYEPLKILTSFVEAWFVYFLSSLILKLPMLREMTIEGTRKVLLFFNVSFAYKMCIGHIAVLLHTSMQVTDLYGFGYLLPTLMAVKMHDKSIAARLTRTTLQTSLVATLTASAIGFSLSLSPHLFVAAPIGADEAGMLPPQVEDLTLAERLRRDKVSMYRHKVGTVTLTPTPREMEYFRAGLQALKGYLRERSLEKLRLARSLLRRADYDVLEIEDRYFYLIESDARRGWGIFVIDANAEAELLVDVPRPIDEWAAMECGAYLFRMFNGRSLALATAESTSSMQSSNDILSSRRGMTHMFHREFGRSEVLQVRGYTRSSVRAFQERHAAGRARGDELESSLWVSSRLPTSVRLRDLKEELSGFSVEWRAAPFKNALRGVYSSSFAELYLERTDRKKLLGRYMVGVRKVQAREKFQRIDGYLREEILGQKGEIADRGTNLYKSPGLEAMLFFDEEVLRPIVQLSRDGRSRKRGGEEFATEVAAIQGAASALNYRLTWYLNKESDEEYLILREDPNSSDRGYWGTYVFRMGDFRPLVVEVPHPLYEQNTFEYGVALFEKLRAGFLLIAGTHPKCNVDNSADVIDASNKVSLFNLVNQTVLREVEFEPMLVMQVRAFGHRPGISVPMADALLSFSDGTVDEEGLDEWGRKLVKVLEADRLHFKFVGGDLDTEGYEVHGNVQSLYLSSTRNKVFATIWLSPFVRFGYRQSGETQLQDAEVDTLGIRTLEVLLHQFLKDREFAGSTSSLPPQLIDSLEHYQRTQDVNALYSIMGLWPPPQYEPVRIVDLNTRKTFLVIYEGDRIWPLVASLSYSPGEQYFMRAKQPLSADEIRKFVDSSAVFLFIDTEDED